MRKCEASELSRILRFYRHVAEDTEDMSEYGRWIYGLHPTDEAISEYLSRGEIYCLEENGEMTAAVAVVCSQGEDYHGVNWQLELADDMVATIHLLAVDPDLRKRGLAARLMRDAMEYARAAGKRAVRLDALACNLPAHRLYRSLGFEQVDVRNWYACNTGAIDFYLFEYLL